MSPDAPQDWFQGIREPAVREALRQVVDPELGVNIVDLGLVYRVDAGTPDVVVTMTLTNPTCPLGAQLTEQVESAVRQAAPSVRSVRVEIVWDPPWSADRMSPQAKAQLGWNNA